MISLKLPVCTHLGEGSVKVVPEIIRRENAKKVVVFTDQGVRQSGVCDVLLHELAAEGIPVYSFGRDRSGLETLFMRITDPEVKEHAYESGL